MVRSIAKQIFKYSHDLEEMEEEEDLDSDIDPEEIERASEMVLLEKIVAKLGTMVEIQQKTKMEIEIA